MAFNQQVTHQMTPEDKQFYKDLGKRIAQFRKSAGLTQVQVAEKLGIAQQTMAHYESGSLRIAVAMLKPLSSVLSISAEELLEEPVTATKKKRGPSSKLEQQVEMIQQLPRAKQKFVMEMLETVIQQAS